LTPNFQTLKAEIDLLRQEVAKQERRWRLVTSTPDTGELDRSAFYLDILANLFSEEELRTLCFDMGIDYEALPASSKPGKARELMEYCRRHNRLAPSEKHPGLYARVRAERPYLFEAK
jgi:hypothetical protein